MGKTIKVHKNHVFLTIFFTILAMGFVVISSFLFIVNTAFQNFSKDCSNFDGIVEKVSKLEELEISQQEHSILFYGELLTTQGIFSTKALRSNLTQLEKQGEFEALAFLTMDGKINTDNQMYFDGISRKTALSVLEQNQSTVTIFQNEETKKVYYAVVVYDLNDEKKGVLIGALEAQISEKSFGEGLDENTLLYVLNEKNEVVSYSNDVANVLEYKTIPEQSFFVKNKDPNVQMKKLLSNIQALDKNQLKQNLNAQQTNQIIFSELGGLQALLEGDTYLYYEKPMIVGEKEWKLVVAKTAGFSEESISSLISIGCLVAAVIVFFLFVMMIFIFSQSISNHKLSKVAYMDFVTEWYNWNRFKMDAKKRLKRHRTRKYVMVTFDIRKFRTISDMNGHYNGELIIKRIADVLKGQIRKKEHFSRFAVDEFAILMIYTTEEELLERVKKIEELLQYTGGGNRLKFAFGIYYITDYGMSVSRMYTYSSMAKDIAKKRPDGNIGMFTEELRAGMLREKELESNMEEALRNQEFHMYLQPKYSSNGKQIEGAEALVRWISPKLGFISPGDFIPLFEKNGFIISLDHYMLEQVCRYQRKWLNEGKQFIVISVNLSRAHLMEPNLVIDIIKMVDFYGLPHSCIELELTESAFFDDKQVLLNTVLQLRKAGFLVSMDDFGSGYSSLNSLKDLPLDVIKLDGEFFKYSENRERSETVIEDTIQLAKHLHMKIVAEGIETKEQVDFLEQMGCDLIQGFYFAKPMPIGEFELLMGYGVITEPKNE